MYESWENTCMYLYFEKRDIPVYDTENIKAWLGATRMDGMQRVGGGAVYDTENKKAWLGATRMDGMQRGGGGRAWSYGYTNFCIWVSNSEKKNVVRGSGNVSKNGITWLC